MTQPSRIAQTLQTGADAVSPQLRAVQPDLASENDALREEISRLRLRVLDLERQADTDPLVSLYNRRAFMREITRAQSVMDRYDVESSIIFFDLDGFKAVNDAFGHRAGDQMLVSVADALLAGVRHCDMVARIGGDEFGVLLFKSGVQIARAKAAALSCRIDKVRIPHPDGDFSRDEIGIQASWGTAPCDPGMAPETILERADREMYRRKRGGE